MLSRRRFIRVWASGYSELVEIRVGETFMDAFDRGVITIVDREGLKVAVNVKSEPVNPRDVAFELGMSQ